MERGTGGRGTRARLLVSLGALLVAVLFAEVVLRGIHGLGLGLNRELYMSGSRTRFGELHSLPELMDATGHGFSPFRKAGDFRLNSKGFKTHEYTDVKAAGSYRVVVLGDSFTFSSGGVPYASLWHVRLQRRLERELDRPVEVISLGVPAIGPDFQLRLWQVEGRRLSPDLVVLAFFVGNDFSDVTGTLADRGLADHLSRHSYVFRLVRNVARLSRHREQSVARLERLLERRRELGATGGHTIEGSTHAYDPDVPSHSQADFDNLVRRRMGIAEIERAREFEAGCGQVTEILNVLAAEVEDAGSRLVVMVVPDELQVDATLRERHLREAGKQASDLDLARPQRCLTEALEAAGVACLDLLPLFQAEGAQRPLYRVRDTHWNEVGNELAASALGDFLRSLDVFGVFGD